MILILLRFKSFFFNSIICSYRWEKNILFENKNIIISNIFLESFFLMNRNLRDKLFDVCFDHLGGCV